MQYKVGDKVKLRDDLECYKSYGGITFYSEMKEIAEEKILTIKEILYNGNLRFEETDGWSFNLEMIEPIETNNEKKENNMKILDIYEERMREKIYQEEDKKIREIKEKDVFQCLYNEYQKQFNELYKNEFNKEYKNLFYANTVFSKETQNKADEIVKNKEKNLIELDKTIEEVKAQLEIIPDEEFAAKKQILIDYGILDKKGKINV